MAPQYFAQDFYNTRPGYLTPEEPTTRTVLLEPAVEAHPEAQRRQGCTSSASLNHAVPSKPKSKPLSTKKPKNQNVGGDAGLRFFVVGHPDELKDKTQMRKNRVHVMHNYLDKESQKPDSTDSRVHGPGHGIRRRKYVRDSANSLDSSAGQNLFRRDVSRLTPADSVQSSGSSHDTSDREGPAPTSYKAPRAPLTKSKTVPEAPSASPFANHNTQPLVEGLGGRYDHSKYMLANTHEVPFPPESRKSLSTDPTGGKLDPFGAWAQFNDPMINVNELKWSCSQRFGTTGLSVHWIPTMLKARHAFLSTLCISSSYDDLMKRSLLPAHRRNNDSLIERFRVRQSVISMINESLNDPEMRIADGTIIAVLHVLNSEIMGCDDRSMRIHQVGLQEMVQERGGLDRLGVSGQLASILTITNYLIGALRETPPHRDYVSFASKQVSKIPNEATRIPESPIYCRPQGFDTIKNVLAPGSATYELLEMLRTLTKKFYVENSGRTTSMPSPSETVTSWERSGDTVASLCGKIFAIPPAWEQDFTDMNERYTFESIRLVALIYAHAMSRKIPFSTAAAEVRKRNVAYLPDDSTRMPIMIKNALMRTDTSHCWDQLLGVLFWVALIAGATANPGPFANEEREGEDEDARKWLTAIAVRCCIVLSFQHGHAVLETLKRLVAIETVLGTAVLTGATSHPSDPAYNFVESESDQGYETHGPSEPPSSQRGMADFAQEFMST